MSAILNFFTNLWDQVVVLVTSVDNPILEILDILIVTFIIYKAIQFMRQTRAEQLMKGILVFLLAYAVAQLLNLKALIWIMSMVYVNAIVVIVVLFQPELRSMLERMGRGSITKFGKLVNRQRGEEVDLTGMINAVCKACQSMQSEKIGALIVIERSTMLGEIAETGTLIESDASRELICNIFYPKAPLHDGALLIREDKLYAAGCILPLTQNNDIDSNLGTRHRAAIGVSEVSDAIVVVVSEETGIISVATGGMIQRNYNMATLKVFLEQSLFDEEQDIGSYQKLKNLFKRKGAKPDEKKINFR